MRGQGCALRLDRWLQHERSDESQFGRRGTTPRGRAAITGRHRGALRPGCQFRARKFANALHHNGLTGSMGRVGACADNAAMESFFALLQKNVLDRRRWATRQDLRLAIITWIERTYHRRRRQDRLGKLTPVEYEMLYTKAAHAA